MDKLYAVVDLQFGSCGKGLLAGVLAKKYAVDTIITAWSPNAGHTFVDNDGVKYVNTALPNGIISESVRQVLIGPGSVVNPEQMMAELDKYSYLMENIDLIIHESAAIVTQEHRDMEARYAYGIGSTMKGVGEATISKIRRPVGDHRVIARDALIGTPLEGYVVSAQQYNDALDRGAIGLIEGAQGFSLSINQGFYPYCTSRECTIHQLLSDCAVPRYASYGMEVWGACRTYPIRVANRYDKDGNQIGTSGPCYPDQHELCWEEIGRQPELTTVTQLPRRIFTWSHQQIEEAVRMNGVDHVFLNFVNYIDTDPRLDKMDLGHYRHSIETAGSQISLVGIGPAEQDVMTPDEYLDKIFAKQFVGD